MTLAVSIAQGGSNNVTMRNRIINGAMMISQRNGTNSVTPASGDYTLDRWRYEASQASKFTIQQNAGSVTPPAGFINYLGATVASSVSIGAGDYFMLEQFIEGFNVADLGWGTTSAQSVTLSFKVYSSLTGTFGGALLNNAQNRSYPFTYTISSANTWTSISITVPGDTSGTWLTNNGRGIYLNLSLGIGSTYSGAAGAWAGANYLSATGATSVVGTGSATFYITGVQLEAGTTATPFEQRLYGTELALCQRYCQVVSGGTIAYASTTAGYAAIAFPTAMRTAPSLPTILGTVYWANMVGTNPGVTGSPTWSFYGSPNYYGANISMTFNAANASSVSAGQVGTSYVLNAAYGFLFSAEL